MKKIALVLTLALAGCQPPVMPVQSLPALSSPSRLDLRLTVINAYPLHDVSISEIVDVHCGRTTAEPLQPYESIVGYGQANEAFPMRELLTGNPAPCFAQLARRNTAVHRVLVAAEELFLPLTCRVEITPRLGAYSFALVGPTGTQTRCKLTVTGSRSAVFTYDYARDGDLFFLTDAWSSI